MGAFRKLVECEKVNRGWGPLHRSEKVAAARPNLSNFYWSKIGEVAEPEFLDAPNRLGSCGKYDISQIPNLSSFFLWNIEYFTKYSAIVAQNEWHTHQIHAIIL